MQHPAVARAAAVPVPDERLGEKVCLAFTVRPGHSLEAIDLLAHLDRAGLSRYDMPEYYLVLQDIPLTASGKIVKTGLAAQIREGTLTPVAIRWDAASAAAR